MHSIPEDFERALRQSQLHDFFHECAYVHRAGYLSWIITSVRPATRHRRIQRAVARLQAQRSEVEAAARGAALAEIERPAAIIAPGPGCVDSRQSA